MVKLMIKRGADVNAEMEDSKLTLLVRITYMNRDSIVHILLNAGALVDKRAPDNTFAANEKSSPLMLHLTAMKWLRDCFSSVGPPFVKLTRMVKLICATELGNISIILRLLNAESRVDAQETCPTDIRPFVPLVHCTQSEYKLSDIFCRYGYIMATSSAGLAHPRSTLLSRLWRQIALSDSRWRRYCGSATVSYAKP